MGRSYNLRKSADVSARYDNHEVQVKGFSNETTKHEAPQTERKVKRVGPFELFRFADGLDRFLMVLGLLGGIGHGIGQQINLLILSDTIDLFANATSITENGTVIDSEVLSDSVPSIIMKYCLSGIYIMLCGYCNMMAWCLTSERQVKVIRDKAFRAVLRQHMGWFDKHQAGAINTRLTSDMYSIQSGMGDKVATFMQWSAAFGTGAIVCMIRDWKLTLAILACTPLGLILATIVGKILQMYANRELAVNAQAGATAGEVLGNIRTVTAYGGQNKEALRYKEMLYAARSIGIKRGLVNGVGQGLFWLIVFATISFGYWFGSYLYRTQGRPSVGVVIQIVVALVGGTRALSFAVGNLDYFSMARGGAAVIFDLIDSTSEIDSSSEEGKKPPETYGKLSFQKVDFAYPSRPEGQILQDLNLELLPGQTVALVGSSGSGKSTIVQLIQRFYDPTRGEVTMDGHNLRDLNIKWLRQQIGVVSQEPVLFATTIRENIMFGRDGVTQEDIERAAKEANAHNFITSFPDKYDTLVGSKGAQMSGGQKQRIAIARALIRNPKILLLDDATSALDYQSESVVQEALDKARQGRTTLIVAHRLSTIRNADMICVLDEGRILERGSHDELLAKGGFYSKLISRQTAGADSESEEDEEDLYNLAGDLEVELTPQKAAIVRAMSRQLSQGTTRSSTRSRSSTVRGSGRRRRRTTTARSISLEQEVPKVAEEVEEDVPAPAPVSRIIQLNTPELPLIVVGCVSAAVQGAIFPALAYFSSQILGAFNLPDDEMAKKINSYVLFLGCSGIGASIATFLMVFLFNTSGERLTLRLRDMAFRAMLRQEIGWFDERENQVGSLTSRLATDAAMVKAATGAHLSTLINAFSTVILSMVLAFLFSWQLTLVCAAFIPLLIGTGMVQSAMLVGFARHSKKSMEEGGKLISEAVENVRTVASLTKERYFYEKYNDHFEESFKQGKKRAQVFGLTWGISQSVFTFAYAATYGYGAYLISQGAIEFQDVFSVFVAIANGAVELGRINAFAADYTKAKVSAAKLFGLFERKSKINPMDETGERPAGCNGSVEFKHAAFRYPTRPDALVLSNLSVGVKPGQALALVGASGCGKSTTIQMLERFYDPERGAVKLDGQEVSHLNLSWLRSQLGIVAQEPMLFDTTIRENIAYGDQSREVPMADIIDAARQANIHDFVTTLPNGYDTELGSKGVQLVGGQKQRIAIARALVRNPKILLLDEATSALDTENEMVVQEALDRAQKGRTCIVIAHRLSTIENADVIAVIDGGKVVEIGGHHELMAQKGLYFMLQMIQRGVKVES